MITRKKYNFQYGTNAEKLRLSRIGQFVLFSMVEQDSHTWMYISPGTHPSEHEVSKSSYLDPEHGDTRAKSENIELFLVYVSLDTCMRYSRTCRLVLFLDVKYIGMHPIA